MFRKQALILVLGLCLGATLALKLKAPIRTTAHIQELQQESMQLASAHSDISSQCFGIYRPLLDDITQQYETNFASCLYTYGNASAVIDGRYAQPREDILQQGYVSCNACCQVWTYETQPLETVVARLECASAVAAENSKAFYAISANATELATQIGREYLTVQSEHDICTNNADRIFVEDTATTYENLNDCLSGRSYISTDIWTTTTSPPDTTTTTSEPTTEEYYSTS
ncbi:hypothetical protein KR018_005310 [Drosophila ironensis]|nr:hypothetical protein KR018_005310 [Drosophila ironensis]